VTATSKSTNPWDATFRGRLGYAWDRFMLYGTAGVAAGGLSNAGTSTTGVGWVAGVGLEAALTDKVTGRLEYRHTDLGSLPSSGPSSASNDILIGVGFKF
jgi:outer membrane immunogenic protein